MRLRRNCSLGPSLVTSFRAGGRWGMGKSPGQPGATSTRSSTIGRAWATVAVAQGQDSRGSMVFLFGWKRSMLLQRSLDQSHRGMSGGLRIDQIRRGPGISGEDCPDCDRGSIGTSDSHDYKVFCFFAQGAFLHGKDGQSWHSRSAGRGESSGWQPESSKPTQQGGGCCGWFVSKYSNFPKPAQLARGPIKLNT